MFPSFGNWLSKIHITKGKTMNEEQEKKPEDVEHKERDYFTKPRITEDPDRGQSDTSGSGWSGERWSGRSQSAGRDR